MEWTGGRVDFSASGEINNSGLFDIQTDGTWGFAGQQTQTFNNLTGGELRKSGGVGTTFLGAGTNRVNLANDGGLMDVQSGTLDLTGGLYTFTPGSEIIGVGTTLIDGGAELSGSLSASNLTLQNVTIGADGLTLAGGRTEWAGGSLGGTGTLTVGSGATLELTGGPSTVGTYGLSELSNQGTVEWTGGRVDFSASGEINNSGLFDIQTDGTWGFAGQQTQTFNNLTGGELRKSGGVGTTFLGAGANRVNLANDGGLMDVQSGTLDLTGGLYTFTPGSEIIGVGTTLIDGGAELSGSLSASNLTLQNVTIGADGLTLAGGRTEWAGGSLGGTGTLTVGSGATLELTGGPSTIGTYGLSELSNQGTVEWTGGRVDFSASGEINNSGLFDIQTDGTWGFAGQQTQTFNNLTGGELRKSGGVGTTFLGAGANRVNLANDGGLMDVQSGTLDLTGGLYTFTPGSEIIGVGTTLIDGGAELSGSLSASNLTLQNVTIGADGLTLAGGRTEWAGGSLGGTGTLTVGSGATLELTGGPSTIGTYGLSELSNQGTVEWTGGRVDFSASGEINNSGLFDIQTDGTWGFAGQQTQTFNNLTGGELRKSGGVGTTFLGAGANRVNLANDGGLMDVQSGTLDLTGGLYTFTPGSEIIGVGTTLIDGGAELSGSLSASNLTLQNVTIGADGLTLAGGRTEWAGGSLGGTGTLTVGSGATLELTGGPSTIGTYGLSELSNQGTVEWTGGRVDFSASGEINNSGLFDIQTDGTWGFAGQQTQTFNNLTGGELRKSGGVGTTFLGAGANRVNLANDGGLVDVRLGTLTITPALATQNNGQIRTASETTLRVATGGLTNTPTGTLSGFGTIDVGAGNTLTNLGTISPGGDDVAGNLNLTGSLALGSTSVLNFDIAGVTPGSEYDRLTVSGDVNLEGTINTQLIGGFTPPLGQDFDLITSGGTATGSFTSSNQPSGFNGAIVGGVYRLTNSGLSCLGVCWDGGGGTTSWETLANWSGDQLPVFNDVAYLNLVSGVDVTLSSDQSVKGLNSIAGNNLTINSGGSLTLNDPGTTSTLAGDLTVNGTLNIQAPLITAAFALNGGALGGTGSLTTTNSFTRTGGSTGTTLTGVTLNQASGDLSPGAWTVNGPVSLTAAAGNLVFDEPVSATTLLGRGASGLTLQPGALLNASASTGNSLVLDAGTGAFTNQAGAGALVVAPGARWLVYSPPP